jgi:cytochrome b pre-mRNA-processing protein 3
MRSAAGTCLAAADVSILVLALEIDMNVTRFLRRFVKSESAGRALFEAIIAQARRPEFYRDHFVPDTLDGRFDMIALHLFLVLRRLKIEGPGARALSAGLVDRLFADLDRSLREMGAGDLGIGRRVKIMAKAFYGRVAAYEAALAMREDRALSDALVRNLYGTVTPPTDAVATMTRYVRAEANSLARQPLAEIEAGRVAFSAPPARPSAERAA